MIIGNGLLANSFQEYFESQDNVLIFASGVSNSNETRLAEFEREERLLIHALQNNKNKIFVYFSSCDINDGEERKYFLHKLNMENLVKESRNSYYIFRLPQVVGKSKNQNTIVNFLILNIKNNICFNVWRHAERNLIDIDDVVAIAGYIIKHGLYLNSTVNIASSVQYSIFDVIKAIEKFFDKKAVYTITDKGKSKKIDIDLILPIISKLDISFNDNYFNGLLCKYYTK